MKTKANKPPQIDARHPEYKKHQVDWDLIDDCLAGQRKIKDERTKYLPKPGCSTDTDERYSSYLMRAVFLNFTGETRKNLVGQCFAIKPVYSGPVELEALLDSIDGAGVSGEQQSKCALGMVLAFSRAGIFTDYPKTDGDATKEDVETGNIAPKIILYHPKQIINWDTIQRGARTITSFVMIEETYVKEDDGYNKEMATQWRELRLVDDSTYTIRIWRRNDTVFEKYSEAVPQDSNGLPFDEIPFDFIGADANNSACERPLLLDIAMLNIAHYIDSADYQETVHMVGQPTPWASGLDQNWIDNIMGGKMHLGSRAVIPLPVDAQVGFLQVEANTLPKEAMDQKEDQARQLGAKMVEKKEVAQTATEKSLDEASRSSILAGVCTNVSEAYKRALNWATKYTGVENKAEGYPQGATYELNTEFAVNRISPEERAANREDYNAGLIDFEESRDNLKSGGVAYKDDELVQEYHDEKSEADFMQAQKAFAMQASAKDDNNEPEPNKKDEK